MSEHLSARCTIERGSTRLRVRPLQYFRGELRQRAAIPPERQFRRPAKTRSKGSASVTMSPDTSRQVIVFTFLVAAALLAVAIFYF
jgi:hypothetical protein